MSKYAIIVKAHGQQIRDDYYPDPFYDNIEKAKKKVVYLQQYRIEHNMTPCEYTIKELNDAEIERYNKEWAHWCSMID